MQHLARTFTMWINHNWWESKSFPIKMYKDPIQEYVQKMIGRCLILSFGLFKYKEDADIGNYVPKLPMPHDACIHRLLDIVKAQQGMCLCEINSDEALSEDERKALWDRFVKTCQCIMNSFIASQLLGALSTVQVGKNGTLMVLCWVDVFVNLLHCCLL